MPDSLKKLRQYLLSGVSYVIPIIACGGILIALSEREGSIFSDKGLDLEKVNVNGGSIAIGHPLGCSGVRISTTLLHEMSRRNAKYGLATMCVGVGQGAAVIYENIPNS